MDTKSTVLWLGSGFSYGSQHHVAHRPPLGHDFFGPSNTGVRARLEAYPVLEVVWKAYDSPANLEEFWSKLDDDFNQGGSSVNISESSLSDALDAARRNPAPCSPGTHGLLRDLLGGAAIAGRPRSSHRRFELKCLLQDAMRRAFGFQLSASDLPADRPARPDEGGHSQIDRMTGSPLTPRARGPKA